MRAFVGLVVWGLCLTPAFAEDLIPMSDTQHADFAAIGQISYGGQVGAAICTGTLVAPDLVLTAGHCVAPDGEVMQPADVQFAAAWRAGSSLAIRHGDEIIMARSAAGQKRDLPQDMALIVLDDPIDANVVVPIALLNPADLASNYAVFGYRRDAPDLLQGALACPLLQAQPGLLQLGCAVVSGNSGGPVLLQKDGRWRLAAVVVAASGHGAAARAYAATPTQDMRRLINVP